MLKRCMKGYEIGIEKAAVGRLQQVFFLRELIGKGKEKIQHPATTEENNKI